MIHSYKRVGCYRSNALAKMMVKCWTACLMACLISLGAMAQDVLTGKVTDANDGTTLPGVSVALKGTSRGTQTDANGMFKINANAGATLVFSFVGYLKKEVVWSGSSMLNVPLTPDNQSLEEVVVVGYGTVKKKDLTGAVSTIGVKDFQKGIITSPEQLLQGRVAGVQITQSSGEPGGGINVRIRGTSSVYGGNQPLFVVDGVPLSGDNTAGGVNGTSLGTQPPKNPLNFLNPNDIASVDILKDASATAIYGSRGANGVVIITTKKGSGRGSLNYDISYGFSSITKKYDLLSPAEYIKANPTQDLGGKTDWQDELFRTALTKQHNLSFGGGDATGHYRISLGFLDQEGIVRRSSVKRNNLSFTGGKKFFGDKLNINSNLTVSNNSDGGVPNGLNSGFEGDLIGGVLKSNPTLPVFKSPGVYYQTNTSELNPIALLNLSKDNTSTLRALGNINAEWQIVKALKFKTVLGFDQSMSSRKAAFSKDLVVAGIKDLGRVSIADIETANQLWENYFTYDKSMGRTSLNVMAGYSYQSFHNSGRFIQASNFRTNDLDIMINNLASTEFGANKVGAFVSNSYATKDELQSYFGRANVSIAEKYLLTATLRVDGSSKFGGSNKYGYFPSFAAKWKIIQEAFMPKGDFLNDLALRLGYGLTGNQNIPHNLYDQRDRYNDWGTGNDAAQISGGGFSPVTFNNPNLKWETTASYNLGLDFSILKNRLSGSLEYYQKNTKDLLFQVISAQPAPTPFAWKNLNTDISNKGLELNLTAIIADGKDFSWEVLVNGAYNKNLVKNLDGVYDTGEISGQGLTGAFAQRIAAGQPLFSFFLRPFGGFDESGNSIYPLGDFQQFMGYSALPTLTGGLTNNFKYHRFDLSFFFNGVFGNYIYNNTDNAYFTQGALNNGRNVTRNVVGNGEGAYNAPDVSSRFIQNGDFVRLQNLTLGYQVPTKGKVLSGLRLFVTGQNLLTFTKYTGQDPEVNTNKTINGISSLGIDYQAYPRARTITLGANFSF